MDAIVEDKVIRFFEAREEGRELSLEDLCDNCPEKRKVVAYAIADQLAADTFARGAGARTILEPKGVPHRYTDLKYVIAGGMGRLFRATDSEANREVAYKVLRSELDLPLFRDYFLFEARLTAEIDHPSVVPIHGVIEDGCGLPAYAMAYIHGETFAEKIQQHHSEQNLVVARNSFRLLLSHFVLVCRTVAYAHEKSIMHNDIKSNNIRIRSDDKPFVVDWGLAKKYSQELGVREKQSDIQALARLLAEILGKGPWQVAPLAATVEEVLKVEAEGSLRDRRGNRYTSANLLAESVQQWLDTGGTPDYRDWWHIRLWRLANQHQAIATGIAASFLLITVLIITGIEIHATNQLARFGREWSLHNDGTAQALDAILDFRNESKEPFTKQKMREAIATFRTAVEEFPDQPAHQYRLAQCYFFYAGLLFFSQTREESEPRPVDQFFESERILLRLSAQGIDVNRLPGLSGRPQISYGPTTRDILTDCRTMIAVSLLGDNRHSEAFEVINLLAKNHNLQTSRRLSEWELLIKLPQLLSKMRSAQKSYLSPEDVLSLRDAFQMAAEVEQSKMPWSRGKHADHLKAMRLAKVLAESAGVSDAAVYNAACVYALASADSRFGPEERERWGHQSLEYLARISKAGYFRGAKQFRELNTDSDLHSLRERADFQQLLHTTRWTWALQSVLGGVVSPHEE